MCYSFGSFKCKRRMHRFGELSTWKGFLSVWITLHSDYEIFQEASSGWLQLAMLSEEWVLLLLSMSFPAIIKSQVRQGLGEATAFSPAYHHMFWRDFDRFTLSTRQNERFWRDIATTSRSHPTCANVNIWHYSRLQACCRIRTPFCLAWYMLIYC